MLYSQYLRIETKAGGVFCTDKDFIKAARTLLTGRGKSNEKRAARHRWLRAGLSHLSTDQNSFISNRL